MKLLVTGGAGFIGSNYIYETLEAYENWDIVCLDKLSYAGNIENLTDAAQDKRFSFIKADITDRDRVFEILKGGSFDAVVNFAAETHVDRSIEDPGVFLHSNIIGTQVLMDACIEFNIPRFHQISTDEVYGDLPLDRPDLSFREDTPLCTSSPYSASKASADLLVMAYHRTYGLPVTISRCSNNYGPFQFPEKLIPLMIFRALNNESLPVYGDGLNVRDWLHVRDHCKAINTILEKGTPGQVYNIGGSSERQNIAVVKTILKALDKSEELIEYVKDRPGHDRRYAISHEKISSELGWEPSISFDEGIKDTIDWYLNNRRWLDGIVS